MLTYFHHQLATCFEAVLLFRISDWLTLKWLNVFIVVEHATILSGSCCEGWLWGRIRSTDYDIFKLALNARGFLLIYKLNV